MESQKYITVDRKFLDTFYRECGREITLAYTVLNQANSWSITFLAVVFGTGLVGLVKESASSPGEFTFKYPNPFHWLYMILAWGLVLRFLQRSALALSNMYRWNKIAAATWEILALPLDHTKQPSLNDALVELVDRLMMKWQDPRNSLEILWASLKLMYFAPVVLLLALIGWGLYVLPHDGIYLFGLCVLIAWTAIEVWLFFSWNRGSKQALSEEKAQEFSALFARSESQTTQAEPPDRQHR